MTDGRGNWTVAPPGSYRSDDELVGEAVRVVTGLWSDDDLAHAVAGLREACSRRLLALSPKLRLEVESADGRSRDALERFIAKVIRPLTTGAPSAFLTNYSRELLAQVVPLLAPGHPPADELAALLRRAHGHDLISRHSRQRTAESLIGRLFEAAGPELLAKAGELVRRSPVPAARRETEWIRPPGRLLLSVDHTTLSCARYLSGLETPSRDPHGFDELHPQSTGRAKRIDQVTVKFESGSSETAPEVFPSPPSELKAKTLLALLSLAAEQGGDGAGPRRVTLRTLLDLLGYRLGVSTNGRYFRLHAAQAARHVLVDLPNRIVAMQASMAGAKEPLLVFERLLVRALPLDDAGREISLAQALDGPGTKGGCLYGFEFEFSREFLEALGMSGARAVEHVPVEVLSLRGPAFWLAWQIAFLRRWAAVPRGGGRGKALLRVLQEAGYLEASSGAGRVRYKQSVRSWWRDVGELVNLGLLDEPGVRLYRQASGRWREVSGEMSRLLDAGGGRLTRSALEGIRVVFSVPTERTAQLEAARGRFRAAARTRASGR